MDNTQLNIGTGGDIIRTKNLAGVKTEIVQLDLGGESAENLIIAGQKTMANSVPVVMASDYVPLLQQDLISNSHNYYPNRAWNFITGRALANVQNTRVDLWEGPTPVYVFPTTPQQMRLVSTSASDAVGGTGVQQVHIHYLDDTYTYQITTVNLNGLTPVTTVPLNMLRINGMHATAVGSNGDAVGNISLTNLAGTVTYAIITAGFNTARHGIFTIPAGKTGYITQWQGSSGSAAGTHYVQLEIRATAHLGVLFPGVFLFVDGMSGQNFAQEARYDIPVPIPATADVKLSATSDAVNANATALASIFGWIE